MKIVGVDPGEKYCGLVYLQDDLPTFGADLTPQQLIETFERVEADLVAIERFQLWPGRMMAQSYSTLGVVELIGVLKYLCQRRHIPYIMVQPSESKWVTHPQHTHGKTPHQVAAYKAAVFAQRGLKRLVKRVVGSPSASVGKAPRDRASSRVDSRTVDTRRTSRRPRSPRTPDHRSVGNPSRLS